MADPKIAILTPYYGSIDHDHLACMREVEKAGHIICQVQGNPYIDMARSHLVELALENGADILFWIDHDMVFVPDDVRAMSYRLIQQSPDVAALGAAYVMKNPGGKIIAGWRPRAEKVEFYRPGTVEVGYLGFGFTAIRAAVFRNLQGQLPRLYCPTVKRDVYPYFAHMQTDKAYFGEDVSFFKRVTDAGWKVLLDIEPRVHHKGSYLYKIEDSGYVVPNCVTLDVTIDNSKKEKDYDLCHSLSSLSQSSD